MAESHVAGRFEPIASCFLGSVLRCHSLGDSRILNFIVNRPLGSEGRKSEVCAEHTFKKPILGYRSLAS